MVVNHNGICLSQKQEPRLCLIQPVINLQRKTMVIKAKGMKRVPLCRVTSRDRFHSLVKNLTEPKGSMSLFYQMYHFLVNEMMSRKEKKSCALLILRSLSEVRGYKPGILGLSTLEFFFNLLGFGAFLLIFTVSHAHAEEVQSVLCSILSMMMEGFSIYTVESGNHCPYVATESSKCGQKTTELNFKMY